MKTQELSLHEKERLYRPNHLLGMYIVFITALTITYSVITASQYL